MPCIYKLTKGLKMASYHSSMKQLSVILVSIFLSIPVVFAQNLSTQQLPKILTSDTHYLPDFSYAGYKFGMEPIPNTVGTIINVTDYGAIANDGVDDTKAIQSAIAAANNVKGAVNVRFPQGRFIISDIIEIIRDDFVLQGAGQGKLGTTLFFPRPLNMVDDKGKLSEIRKYLTKYNKRHKSKKDNIDVIFSEYSWTAGFIWVGEKDKRGFAYLDEYDTQPLPSLGQGIRGKQGTQKIEVTDPSVFSKGQRIQVLWYNKQGEEGALIKSLYNDAPVKIGSRHWTTPNKPLVTQYTLVTKIDGNTLTIADTLLHDINEQLPTEIQPWHPLEHIGIQDFSFEFPDSPYFGHHVEMGYNGIYLNGLADSWILNLSFTNAESAILTYNSANVTISDIQTHGEKSAHYAVHMGNVHNFLAQRIQIFNPVIHSLTFNTQSTRSVYKDSEVFSKPTLDQHAGANHQNLYDNIVVHVDAVPSADKASYEVYWGSGAGYWQPGHGRFSTTWNLTVMAQSGVPADQTLLVQGVAEGPDARIIGLSGNRNLELEYYPQPYVESLNKRIKTIPSLYDYQLNQRMNAK